MTLDELLDIAEGNAARMLIGTKEELVPMWFILDEKDEGTIAGTPWTGDNEKRVVFSFMREHMHKIGAVAYVVTIEYWFTKMPAGFDPAKIDPMHFMPLVRPRDDPQRREGILFQACNKAETKVRSVEILRDKKGRCRELKRLGGDADKFQGPLALNLLNEGKPLQ